MNLVEANNVPYCEYIHFGKIIDKKLGLFEIKFTRAGYIKEDILKQILDTYKFDIMIEYAEYKNYGNEIIAIRLSELYYYNELEY